MVWNSECCWEVVAAGAEWAGRGCAVGVLLWVEVKVTFQ